MGREIRLTGPAKKDLAGLPASDQAAVLAALERMADDPGRSDIAKLRGQDAEWRLRVGRWRVRFVLDAATIDVLRVLPRDRAYRD